jgi:hypothetical protein
MKFAFSWWAVRRLPGSGVGGSRPFRVATGRAVGQNATAPGQFLFGCFGGLKFFDVARFQTGFITRRGGNAVVVIDVDSSPVSYPNLPVAPPPAFRTTRFSSSQNEVSCSIL